MIIIQVAVVKIQRSTEKTMNQKHLKTNHIGKNSKILKGVVILQRLIHLI